MKKHQMRLGSVIKALFLLSILSVGEVYAASLDDVLGVRSSTTVEGAKSQAKIDGVTEQTRDLLQQFKTIMKVVDGLRVCLVVLPQMFTSMCDTCVICVK